MFRWFIGPRFNVLAEVGAMRTVCLTCAGDGFLLIDCRLCGGGCPACNWQGDVKYRCEDCQGSGEQTPEDNTLAPQVEVACNPVPTGASASGRDLENPS